MTGWPNAATTYFTGGLDEFSVYPKELSAAAVANHYGLGRIDTQAPTAPTFVQGSVGGGNVSLTWTPSTDNTGVAKYRVYRGSTSDFIPSAATLQGETTTASFSQPAPVAGTWYYKVIALDAAGNASQPSTAATVNVGQTGQSVTVTLSPTADAYVNSTTPTTNYGVATGTGSQLASRDGSATVSAQQMFLKFTLPTAPAGTTLTAARLSLRTSTDPTANTTDPTSFRVLGNGWTEAGINWNNRPTGTGPLFGTLASAPALNTAYPVDGDVSTLAGLLGGDVTLRGTTGGSAIDSLRTFSREWGTASVRPVLTLTFSPVTG